MENKNYKLDPFTIARMTDHNVHVLDPSDSSMGKGTDTARSHNPVPTPPLTHAQVIELKTRIRSDLEQMRKMKRAA
jgi:hypothetical protein